MTASTVAVLRCNAAGCTAQHVGIETGVGATRLAAANIGWTHRRVTVDGCAWPVSTDFCPAHVDAPWSPATASASPVSMSPAERAVLAALPKAPAWINVDELRIATELTAPKCSAAVASLVRRGLARASTAARCWQRMPASSADARAR